MSPIPLFLLVGLGAGMLSGLFGVGGGLIVVPALVFGVGYSQIAATGTSLVALLLPVGLGGVWAYWTAGKIDASNIRAGLLVAVGMFFGSYLGSRVAMLMDEVLLKRLFAVLLVVTAVRTWLSTRP